jgi:hypothetical protein
VIARGFLLAGALASAPPGPDRLRSIDVPYQAIPIYMVYTQCVSDHVDSDNRARSADSSQVRQANADALDACRDVRERQLALALAAQTDTRIYRTVDEARAAVRRAFDRFDGDYRIETRGAPAR